MSTLRRLRVAFRWQWRWIVVRRTLKNYAGVTGEVLCALGSGIAGCVLLALSPLIFIWSFTLGVILRSLTASCHAIREMERILSQSPKVDDSFSKAAKIASKQPQ